jgi:diguanylate cyclase (GGDEF)-like protein
MRFTLSLRLKFNLILFGVFVLGVVGAGLYYHRYLEDNALSEVRYNSQVMMETALAIRAYTTERIKPHLDPLNADSFKAETVPAFAATDTLRRLNERYPGYDYKEAVLNPTNLRDRANDWERGIIEQFRSANPPKEITGIHGEGMQQAVYVARPIIIKAPGCLVCHSVPLAAPPSMLKVYGDKNGFGWQLNEAVGMQIVKVSMLYPLQKARDSFFNFMGSLLAIFVSLFVVLNSALAILVIEPMSRVNRRLEDLATKDFLTDLVNRRRFFERLEQAMEEARIKKQGVSVVMFDIDFFKRINDTFGHDSGDVVLKNTALRVRELLRGSDCAARFGGEEFIILLSETRLDAAAALAEAVRKRMADTPFEEVGTVSASFGVAEWNHAEEPRELINRADKALYVAKKTGRNKVVTAKTPTAGEHTSLA